jgi:hypothetical protein
MSIPVVQVANLAQFKKYLSSIHFRRIASVRIDGHVTSHVVYEDDETFVEYEPGCLPESLLTNKNYYEQHVENFATHFTCMTTKNALRDNDRVNGPIFASSTKMYEFNPLDFGFQQKSSGSRLVPYNGALIAGMINYDDKGRPFFERWAQVSDQFLRCVSIILYGEDHPSVTSLCHNFTNGEIESVHRAMMRGNTLAVSNNVQKEVLARKHCGFDPMTTDEIRKRYSRVHNEWINRSSTHIHWYNLVVSLCVFNEAPCNYNIPNNINGHKLNCWVVPQEDVDKLYTLLGVTIVGEKELPVPPAPKLEAVDEPVISENL